MNQLPRHGGWCSGKEIFFGHGRLCKHIFLVCISVLIPSITQTISKLYCYLCKLTFQKNSILHWFDYLYEQKFLCCFYRALGCSFLSLVMLLLLPTSVEALSSCHNHSAKSRFVSGKVFQYQ